LLVPAHYLLYFYITEWEVNLFRGLGGAVHLLQLNFWRFLGYSMVSMSKIVKN